MVNRINNRENDNEKKRSTVKSTNGNSNNNDLKDRQNGRLEKQKTLIRTRNWSGIYDKKIFYWKLQALHGKQFKTTAGRKTIENSGIYNLYHGPLYQK